MLVSCVFVHFCCCSFVDVGLEDFMGGVRGRGSSHDVHASFESCNFTVTRVSGSSHDVHVSLEFRTLFSLARAVHVMRMHAARTQNACICVAGVARTMRLRLLLVFWMLSVHKPLLRP